MRLRQECILARLLVDFIISSLGRSLYPSCRVSSGNFYHVLRRDAGIG